MIPMVISQIKQRGSLISKRLHTSSSRLRCLLYLGIAADGYNSKCPKTAEIEHLGGLWAFFSFHVEWDHDTVRQMGTEKGYVI